MENPLHPWLQQIQGEARKKRTWALLFIAFILDRVWELLEHRFYQTINDWLDKHLETAMEFFKPVLEWFLHTPFTLLILTICGILIHAYRKSRHEKVVLENVQPKDDPNALVVASSDPRITVEFVDERDGQLFKKTALNVVNHGGSEALDVRIEDIPLRAQKVSFPHIAGSIAGQGGNERFDPAVDRPYGALHTALLVTALTDEWNSHNAINMDELAIPLTIHYQNFSRTFKFTTTCTLVFLPYEEILHHAPENKKPVIVIRDFQHKKEPSKM